MSYIYDNWESLVAAVSKRERHRRLARLPSLSSGSSDTSSEDDSSSSFCFLPPSKNQEHLVQYPSDFNQKQVAAPFSSRPATPNNRNSSLASRRKRDLRIQVPEPPALGSCLDSNKCCPNISSTIPSARFLCSRPHRLPLPRIAESGSSSSSSPSTRSPSLSPPGHVTDGNARSPGSRWRKGKLISREALGNIYMGFNSESGKYCVMKETSQSYDDEELRLRASVLKKVIAFQSELKHPNVMQYNGSEMVDDKIYECFEYVSGGPISVLMQEFGRLGEPAIRSYTRQILHGLDYLHYKMTAHGDVKASNIFVDPAGGIKLANFWFLENLPVLSRTFWIESAYWMAPEVINCPSKCSSAIDIWSLGCTIVEMATAKPPFSQYKPGMAMYKVLKQKQLPKIPGHLSAEAKDFLMHCLQWNPENRSTALQLMEHPFVNGTSIKKLTLSGSSRLITEGSDEAVEFQFWPGSPSARAPESSETCSSTTTSSSVSPNSPLSPTADEQLKVQISPAPIRSATSHWDPIILRSSSHESRCSSAPYSVRIIGEKLQVQVSLTPSELTPPVPGAPLYDHSTRHYLHGSSDPSGEGPIVGC